MSLVSIQVSPVLPQVFKREERSTKVSVPITWERMVENILCRCSKTQNEIVSWVTNPYIASRVADKMCNHSKNIHALMVLLLVDCTMVI